MVDKNKRYILVGPFCVLLIWFLFSYLVNESLLPGIRETFIKLFQLTVSGTVIPNLSATLIRTIIGFCLGIIFGVPAGLCCGMYIKLYRSFELVIDFFRSLPATALFPLFLLFFGIGNMSKIANAWFITFWIILINSAYGVINASKTRLKVAQSLKATRWQIFREVTFKESLPQTFIGLRIALSFSMIVIVIAEMFVGSDIGLGQKIYESYLTYEITDLYAWIIVTGIVGYVINKIFVIFEKKTLHWVGH